MESFLSWKFKSSRLIKKKDNSTFYVFCNNFDYSKLKLFHLIDKQNHLLAAVACSQHLDCFRTELLSYHFLENKAVRKKTQVQASPVKSSQIHCQDIFSFKYKLTSQASIAYRKGLPFLLLGGST